MIPKIIHSVWLSGEEMPEKLRHCLDTALSKNEGHDLRVWTLSDVRNTFPVLPRFFEEAISVRKWAFATDWLRLALLYRYGGFYIDSDVLCHRPFSAIEAQDGFISWESQYLLGPHAVGARQGHTVIGDWLALYQERQFRVGPNVIDQTPMPDVITEVSVREHGLRRNGRAQTIRDNFRVLPAGVTTSKLNDGCVAEHLYFGGWTDELNNSTAAVIRDENAKYLKKVATIRGKLSEIVEPNKFEKRYRKKCLGERKKSLVLVDPHSRQVPSVRFWHVAPFSKPYVASRVLKKEPLVSVVVPVYNVDKYLENCLRSLVAQTYANLEIIIVDDGSTDGSAAICEFFASLDSRIKLFKKENGGLGSARNFGLERLSGDLVCFVDSDDWVSVDFVANFVERMGGDCDVVVCDHVKVYPDGRLIDTVGVSRYYGESDPVIQLFDSESECYAWNKMFRRSVFENEYFRFGDGWFEDFAVVPAIIGSARACAYTGKSSYFYVQRPGSILATARNSPQKNLDIIGATRNLIKLQPVFRPRYWAHYYDWKLLKHVLYYRWQALKAIPDAQARDECLNKLAQFVNSEIPWWYETGFIKSRLRKKKKMFRFKDRGFINDVLSRGGK